MLRGVETSRKSLARYSHALGYSTVCLFTCFFSSYSFSQRESGAWDGSRVRATKHQPSTEPIYAVMENWSHLLGNLSLLDKAGSKMKTEG